jgi:hypothetical protein
MVCLDPRHAKKALDMKVNKTDANDAEGLAHLVRAGWYREVRVRGRNAMLAKALLGARSQLLSMSLALENQIRGILKTFGRIAPKGAGGIIRKECSRSDHGRCGDHCSDHATSPSATDGKRQVRRVRPSYHQIGAGRCDLSHAHDDAGDWAHHPSPMSPRSRSPIFPSGRARLVPGSVSHRGASNQEKLTTTATSRDAVIASCALCFTKLLLCS